MSFSLDLILIQNPLSPRRTHLQELVQAQNLLLKEQNCGIGITQRNYHKLRRRDHIYNSITSNAAAYRASSVCWSGRYGISSIDPYTQTRSTWGADILGACNVAGRTSTVCRELAREEADAKGRGRCARPSVRARNCRIRE